MFARALFGVLLVCGLAGPTSADFYEGVLAAQKDDWATAMKEWLPLAKEGNPGARSNVADLYLHGLGVEKNEKEAFKWHTLAAEQGVPKSQLFLAIAYAEGELVAKDPAAALKWAFIARNSGNPDAGGMLFSLIQGVTNDERVVIEREATAWRPKE
ncbi:MAG: sel1 repeat family protein [Alphaproteobacteria bacterium]|nr:sel1 repeat family protein [Alphaproteobacteria bacterium]